MDDGLTVLLFDSCRRDDAQRRRDDNDDVDVDQNLLRDGGSSTGQPERIFRRQSQPQQASTDIVVVVFLYVVDKHVGQQQKYQR